ncbi:hypothetical protein HBI42_046630 [Parastagonospora nodorum]|nr:hypothetical protein HBI42_046630 [Parastagonospora nodorum]
MHPDVLLPHKPHAGYTEKDLVLVMGKGCKLIKTTTFLMLHACQEPQTSIWTLADFLLSFGFFSCFTASSHMLMEIVFSKIFFFGRRTARDWTAKDLEGFLAQIVDVSGYLVAL